MIHPGTRAGASPFNSSRALGILHDCKLDKSLRDAVKAPRDEVPQAEKGTEATIEAANLVPPEPVIQNLLAIWECAQPSTKDIATTTISVEWANLPPPAFSPVQLAGPLNLSKPTFSLQVQTVDGIPPSNAVNLASLPEDRWRIVYDGPQCHCKVDGLKPGRLHALRLHASLSVHLTEEQAAAYTVDTSVVPSKPVCFSTVPTAPEAPAPPALAQRARNALKLKWSVPEEPGGTLPLTYTLQLSPAPLGMEQEVDAQGYVEVYSGGERGFRIAKLQPGTRYTTRVRAANEIGSSPFSLCSAFTTQATVPAMPQPPMPVHASATSVTLEWQPPADGGTPITSYAVERDDGLGSSDFQHVYAGPHRRAEACGLRAGLQYRFRVRAENDEGKSVWSLSSVAVTGAAPPSSPCGLSIVSCNRQTATLSWKPPADIGGSVIGVYEVQLQAKSRPAIEHMGSDWLPIFGGDALACTINSLRAGCSYRARVRGQNAAGWGLHSIPVDINTSVDVPEQPSGVEVLSARPDLLQLQWAAPRHDGGVKISSYRLERRQLDCQYGTCDPPIGQPLLLTFSGESTSATVTALQPGTSYSFRVQAVNTCGASPWGAEVPATTAPAAPLQPLPPLITGAGSSSLTLSWQPPACQGAPLIEYLVHVAEVVASTAANGPGSALGSRSASGSGFGPPPTAADVEAGGRSSPSCDNLHTASQVGNGANGLQYPVPQHQQTNGYHTHGRSSPASSSSPPLFPPPPPPPPPPRAPSSQHLQQLLQHQQHRRSTELLPRSGSSNGGVFIHTADGLLPAGPFSTSGLPPLPPPPPPPPLQYRTAYQGPATTCEVIGLQPASCYSLRVAAANAVGYGPFSGAVCASTAPAPPAAPSTPQARPLSSSSIEVYWAPPHTTHGSPITSYNLEWCPVSASAASGGGGMSSGKGGGGNSNKGGASSAAGGALSSSSAAAAPSSGWQQAYAGPLLTSQVHGLAPGRGYQFRVRAVNGVGCSAFSHPATAYASPDPPCPPPRPTCSQRTATSIKVRWEEPADTNGAVVKGYVVEASTGGFKKAAGPRVGAGKSVESLPAVNGGGGSRHSLANGLHCQAPGNSDNQDVQELQVKGEEQEEEQHPPVTVVYSGPDTDTKVTGLLPGTQYSFRVAATNSAGQGQWSEVESTTTMLSAPGAPMAVAVTACDDSPSLSSAATGLTAAACQLQPPACAIQVRWQAPALTPTSAVAVSFEVAAVPRGEPGSGVLPAHSAALSATPILTASAAAAFANAAGVVKASVSAKAPSLQCRLEKLQPATAYGVRVRAVGAEGAGHGIWSAESLVVSPGQPFDAQSTYSDAASSGGNSLSVIAASSGGGGGGGLSSLGAAGKKLGGAGKKGAATAGRARSNAAAASGGGGGGGQHLSLASLAKRATSVSGESDDGQGSVASAATAGKGGRGGNGGGRAVPTAASKARGTDKRVLSAVSSAATARGPPPRSKGVLFNVWRQLKYVLLLLAVVTGLMALISIAAFG